MVRTFVVVFGVVALFGEVVKGVLVGDVFLGSLLVVGVGVTEKGSGGVFGVERCCGEVLCAKAVFLVSGRREAFVFKRWCSERGVDVV